MSRLNDNVYNIVSQLITEEKLQTKKWILEYIKEKDFDSEEHFYFYFLNFLIAHFWQLTKINNELS